MILCWTNYQLFVNILFKNDLIKIYLHFSSVILNLILSVTVTIQKVGIQIFRVGNSYDLISRLIWYSNCPIFKWSGILVIHTSWTGVVYFDQLFGAARIQKLAKKLFLQNWLASEY